MDQTTGSPNERPGDSTRTGQSASTGRGPRLTEQAGAVIGIFTGVLGVLLSIGFVFLPVVTLPEKIYVLGACLALSAASVAGIGAWRSGRRFGLTAASVCVAVICLVMNNIVSSRPAKPRHLSWLARSPSSSHPATRTAALRLLR